MRNSIGNGAEIRKLRQFFRAPPKKTPVLWTSSLHKSPVRTFQNLCQQKSPPAWMQEAYRPQCIKYSICCPILGDTPSPDGGIPLQDVGTTPSLTGYPPPHWDLARVPPIWTWLGSPPIWTWPGYPPVWTWLGYPHLYMTGVLSPRLDLAGVPSPSPPGVDWQTNWNHYFPSYFGCAQKNVWLRM